MTTPLTRSVAPLLIERNKSENYWFMEWLPVIQVLQCFKLRLSAFYYWTARRVHNSELWHPHIGGLAACETTAPHTNRPRPGVRQRSDNLTTQSSTDIYQITSRWFREKDHIDAFTEFPCRDIITASYKTKSLSSVCPCVRLNLKTAVFFKKVLWFLSKVYTYNPQVI